MELTPRERQVVAAIKDHNARSVKAITRRLRIRRRTVETHLTSINRKLPADHEPGTMPFLRVLLWALRPSP